MKNICISPKKSYRSSSIGATLNSYYELQSGTKFVLNASFPSTIYLYTGSKHVNWHL